MVVPGMHNDTQRLLSETARQVRCHPMIEEASIMFNLARHMRLFCVLWLPYTRVLLFLFSRTGNEMTKMTLEIVVAS